MEKMRPSPLAPGAQATQGTTSAKSRGSHGQGNAVPGDFLGMLSALGQTMLPIGPEADLLAPDTGTERAADTSTNPQSTLFAAAATQPHSAMPPDMMSLLALQAGFAGGQAVPISDTVASLPTAGSSAMQATPASVLPSLLPTGNFLAQATQQGITQTTLPPLAASAVAVDTLAIGSRGVTLASSGGELGLVAQTAALDGAAETQADQGLGVASAAGKKATPSPRFSGATTANLHLRATTDFRQEPLDRQVSSAALASVLQAAATGAVAQRDPLAAGAGGQHPGASGATPFATQTPLGLSGQEGFFASQGQGQGANRGGDGRGGASGQGAEAGGWQTAVGSVAEPAHLGDNPFADLAAALPAEDAVAEQVSYWVSQNIQNAELTVDHDGHPVEVMVSLNGNEAHISFRSDQDETRALLDASMAQLRDLLESQGLTLSGMTVGHSASQSNRDNNGSQRDNPRGARQTTTVQASTPVDGTRRSSGLISDKAVDVFV